MQKENSFLGCGWSFPPRFNKEKKTVEMVSDEADIKESLQIILSTIPSERIMQTNFGCDLNQFMFENITHNLIMKIKNVVYNAILNYESRIQIYSVDIKEGNRKGLLLINIIYDIYSVNTRSNIVYPFYLNENQ